MKCAFNLVALGVALSLSQSAMAEQMEGVAAEEELVEWTVVSPGIQKRVTEEGELVHAYQGKEGIAAILLEKQRELRMAEVMGDKETANSLMELVADLKWLHEESDSVASMQDMSKFSQTVSLRSRIPRICGLFNSATAEFSIRQSGLWDLASVKAATPGFGTGPQLGPPPPPPASTFRSVFVKVVGLGGQNPYTLYAFSHDKSQRIEAVRSRYAAVDRCIMETVHTYSATCSNNATEGAVVTVEQTCANLRRGINPAINP